MSADAEFPAEIAGTLAALPGVVGVALGGSRAAGSHRPDSDWDFALYYSGFFDVDAVRALGWPGQLTDVGGWGPLFNGGGAVRVDGRPVDIHYRDLELIETIHADAEAGAFQVEPLLFHQAGIPSYILLAELALGQRLAGVLPLWDYPEKLSRTAPGRWWGEAELTLHYAVEGHARHGRIAQCAGLLSEAACRTAHAILAHRGEWITNEKQLLTRAGLRGVDELIARIGSSPDDLVAAAEAARSLLGGAIDAAGIRPYL